MKFQSQNTTYETSIYTGDKIPFWMLHQYQYLRYRFIKKTDWEVDLDHSRQLDVDEFDRLPETTHIIVTAFDEIKREVKVIGGVRLIQTVHHYQLQNDSYSDMKTTYELPMDEGVVEGTRWITKVDGSEMANVSISLLMQEMYAYCSAHNMTKLIAAVPTKWEQWLNAYNISTEGHRDTDIYRHHAEKYLIVQFDINEVFAGAGEQQRVAAGKVAAAA